MAGEWVDTRLWAALKEDTAEKAETVRVALKPFMDEVDAILEKSGTSAQSFTLHDGDHSFRVAQRMAEVVPEDSFAALSHYELALLLLSAYLHDIGMTPEAAKLTAHREFLLGEENELSEDEAKSYVSWLDASGIAYPAKLSPRDAEWIVDRYVRVRHVDWGEEWTRRNTAGMSLGSYRSWRDDLCALCRSHGEGYEYLSSDAFEPKTVDSGSVVHLRYLALVLRMADVLEFDPERTPEAVYRHRAIEDSSKIFWHKDHDISLDIENARQVRITARPRTALVHRAVAETAEDVDRELGLSRQVAENNHLRSLPGSEKQLPHRWDLPPRAWTDIQPAAGSYEYIDGAFRPNTDRVLELVAGTALYAEPFAAVRELLSNGFDAIRASIALERDQERRGLAAERRRHRLILDLQEKEGGWWLSCTDTGIGMDKRGIEQHFLVAGSPLRSRLLDLARRSREAGDRFERSGEFGIGVLSYFMVADKIVMTTSEIGSAEGGWRFEVEDLEGFGELRHAPEAPGGTTVSLRLRDDLFDDVDEWTAELVAYVSDTVIRTPCDFELHIGADSTLKMDEGWTAEEDAYSRFLLDGIAHRDSGEDDSLELLVGERSRTEAKRSSAEARETFEDAAGRLRWHIEEGRLNDDLGSYRIAIPYWELDGGPCRLYLKTTKAGQTTAVPMLRNLLYAGHAYAGFSSARASWYGMGIEADATVRQDLRSMANGIIEIDFDSPRAGNIQLRRDQAELSDEVIDALQALKRELQRISAGLSVDLGESAYRSLNAVFAISEGDATAEDWRWLGPLRSDRDAVWERVRFPCICGAPVRFDEQRPMKATQQRKRVSVLPALIDASMMEVGLPWHGGLVSPDAVMWFENRDAPRSDLAAGVVPIWRKPPSTFLEEDPLLAEFPPEWSMLCGVHWSSYGNLRPGGLRAEMSRRTVWNEAHPLVRLADPDARRWAAETFEPDVNVQEDWRVRLARLVDPAPHRDSLQDRAKAAAWLLRLLSYSFGGLGDFWAGACERHDGYLNELWEQLGLSETNREPTFLRIEDNDLSPSRASLVSPSGWRDVELKRPDDWSVLPRVGKEWRLSIRADG